MELSIAYVTDYILSLDGVFVDDVEVSTGQGTTSFEDGLGTWTVPGPPPDSPGNALDWIVGGTEDAPPSTGEIIAESLARQPEIIDLLADNFGRYPWRSAGGIVDDEPIGFALETQTRPVYDHAFFSDPVNGAVSSRTSSPTSGSATACGSSAGSTSG